MSRKYLKLLNHKLIATAIVFAPFLLVRCGDSFMKQKVTNEAKGSFELAATADSAGNYTGTIDPHSTATQVLRATSGDLSGSAIALPPGALGINLNITIGSGETLASSDTTQQLGLGGNSATAAGPSVSFVPSQNVQATNPFTLSIPVSGTSLAFALANSDNDNLVVMYKWMKVTDGVPSYSIGIITRDQLTIGSKTVQFQTDKFGTFQLAVTQTKITEPVNKPTAEPPVLKADASNPLVGVWSDCKANNNNNNSNGGNGPNPTVDVAAITAQVTQQLADLKAAEAQKIAGYCYSTGSPKINFILNSSPSFFAAGNPFTADGYKVIGGSAPALVSGGSSSAVPVAAPFDMGTKDYATPGWTNNATDKFFVQITSPGCHFGTTPGMDRFYFPSCNAGTVQVYCDGRSLSDTINDAIANAKAANGNTANNGVANTAVGTSVDSGNSTNSNGGGGGGGRDQLGIPPTANTFAKEYVKFSASTFMHSRAIFADASCSGALISRVEEAGAYKLGAQKADGTYGIAITFSGSNATIFPQGAVDFANKNPAQNGCGFSDWAAGTAKNLSGSSCQKSDKGNNGPTIFKIDSGKIYFDDGGSGILNTKDSMSREQ